MGIRQASSLIYCLPLLCTSAATCGNLLNPNAKHLNTVLPIFLSLPIVIIMRLYLLALVPVALAQTTTSTTGSGTATAAAPASTGSSITVGVGPGLVFNPNTITANPGDTVVFQFLPQNHSVVQGDYSKPFVDPSFLCSSPPKKTHPTDIYFQLPACRERFLLRLPPRYKRPCRKFSTPRSDQPTSPSPF